MQSSSRTPKYCRQKSRAKNKKDRAFIIIPNSSKRIYLGDYGSPESKREYARIVAELADGIHVQEPTKPSEEAHLTVSDLVSKFWIHAQSYYLDAEGKPTGEADNYKYAIRPLLEFYGDILAKDFGPKSLKELRTHMMNAKKIANIKVNKQHSRGTSMSRSPFFPTIFFFDFPFRELPELLPAGSFFS